MKRRTFLKALGVGVSLCFVPELAAAETPVVPEPVRYRVLLTLPSHGEDADLGGCAFHQRTGQLVEGDIVIRTGELDLVERVNITMERLYNETRGMHMWFAHEDGFWSDTKHLSRVQGGLPMWFERI